MHISFKLRKKNAMNKLSMAKSEHLVDVAMYDILDALNAHPDLFTTSSCSGRIQLIAVPDVGRKDTIVMRHRWHHELNFEELEEIINTSEINEDAVVILQTITYPSPLGVGRWNGDGDKKSSPRIRVGNIAP